MYASNVGAPMFIGMAGTGAASGIAVTVYEWIVRCTSIITLKTLNQSLWSILIKESINWPTSEWKLHVAEWILYSQILNTFQKKYIMWHITHTNRLKPSESFSNDRDIFRVQWTWLGQL